MDTSAALKNGRLAPNTNDGLNHVYKIICGVGNHSKGGAVLVKVVPPLLDELCLEYHYVKQNGVFLVRLIANSKQRLQ